MSNTSYLIRGTDGNVIEEGFDTLYDALRFAWCEVGVPCYTRGRVYTYWLEPAEMIWRVLDGNRNILTTNVFSDVERVIAANEN